MPFHLKKKKKKVSHNHFLQLRAGEYCLYDCDNVKDSLDSESKELVFENVVHLYLIQ